MPSYTEQAQAVAIARLLGYARLNWSGFKIGGHHQRIAASLEAIERGDITRLIITMPPRHGKTQLASRYFPAWYLGRNPARYVIAATYAQEFADDIGRDVRNLMLDERHLWLFPSSKLREDSASARRFQTIGAGAYYAVGAGGPITGRGAHLLLIDDPIKGREDADSEVMRRKLKDWYTSVAYTRLMPGGAIVIIQTRWHDDDLAGWLLREHASENWTVLSLPAVDVDGRPLWGEQYDLAALQRIKAALPSRDWHALYQQEPAPDDGIQFKADWFKRFRLGEHPVGCRYYMSSDYAVTPDAGDVTEHAIWALDHTGAAWVVDWWHGQTGAEEWIERGLDLVDRYRPLWWIGEGGVIGRTVEPIIRRRMIERQRTGGKLCRLEWVAPTRDKQTRARAFEARASMGLVNIPHCEWGDRLLDQLVRFPAGRYDDAVDACSLFALALDEMSDGIAPEEPEKDLVIEYVPPTFNDILKGKFV